jgi:hypothetical protein
MFCNAFVTPGPVGDGVEVTAGHVGVETVDGLGAPLDDDPLLPLQAATTVARAVRIVAATIPRTVLRCDDCTAPPYSTGDDTICW